MIVLITLFLSQIALAQNPYDVSVGEVPMPDQRSSKHLVCGYYNGRLSCVSKASIEKDEAELKLIKLQIQELEAKAQQKDAKKK